MAHTTRTVRGVDVEVVAGDITRLDVEAIVNAANERLRHGGGVAAAIARGGGPAIQRESDEWVEANGPLSDGQAAVTTGGELPARIVVHVAGPVYDEDAGDNEQRLRAAVGAALDAAGNADAASVALPAISAGIYGYPPDEASRVIADEVVRWLSADRRGLDRVVLVGFDDEAAGRFAAGLDAAG